MPRLDGPSHEVDRSEEEGGLTWVPPDGIDQECVELCMAMNSLPGIETTESCCGHGKTPFHVFFRPEALEALPELLYWIKACHSGVYGWDVEVYTDCSGETPFFVLRGPVGDFEGANTIARAIAENHAGHSV